MICKAIIKRPRQNPFGSNIHLGDNETMVEALRRIANNGEMNSSGDWNIKTIDGDLRVVHVGYSYTSDRHDMSIRMLVEDFWSVIEGGTKSPITFNSTLIIFKYDGSRHMSLTDEDVDCIANLIIDMDVGWSGNGVM